MKGAGQDGFIQRAREWFSLSLIGRALIAGVMRRGVRFRGCGGYCASLYID